MCKVKQLKPTYINVKINGQNPQDKRTTINAIRFRINQEIKFLYCKKQNLHQRLYYLHLAGAHHYDCMWQHIQEYIESHAARHTTHNHNQAHSKQCTTHTHTHTKKNMLPQHQLT